MANLLVNRRGNILDGGYDEPITGGDPRTPSRRASDTSQPASFVQRANVNAGRPSSGFDIDPPGTEQPETPPHTPYVPPSEEPGPPPRTISDDLPDWMHTTPHLREWTEEWRPAPPAEYPESVHPGFAWGPSQAQWSGNPDYRQQWLGQWDKYWEQYEPGYRQWVETYDPNAGADDGNGNGNGGNGDVWGNPGDVPTGVDKDDPKWAAWLTPAGSVPNKGNIIRFLQTHFPAGFNNAAMAGETQGAGITAHLQWLFGAGITFDGKDKITLPDGSVIDIIENAEGPSGGTSWVWYPVGSGSPTTQPTAGPGQSPAGPVQSPTPGSGDRYSWFNPYQTPGVNFPAPGASTEYIPDTPPADGLPTSKGFPYTNQPIPTYQQFQYDPNITYRPGQLGQFQALDQSGLNQLQQTTVQQMLQNPTLSDQVLSQMREQHKDTVLSMGGQLGQQAAQRAASLGRTGGGSYGSAMGDINQAMVGDITKGYRDLNVQAADVNRQAQERALGLSEDVLSGQMNRGIAGYQAGLGGQMAQEGLYQQGAESLRGAELLRNQEHQRAYANQLANQQWLREGQQLQAGEGFRAFGTEQQRAGDLFNRYLSSEQLQQQRAQTELQRYQAWANQQAQQQQMAIQMYLGRGSLAAGQDALALQRLQEQRYGRQWGWENMGSLLG